MTGGTPVLVAQAETGVVTAARLPREPRPSASAAAEKEDRSEQRCDEATPGDMKATSARWRDDSPSRQVSTSCMMDLLTPAGF